VRGESLWNGVRVPHGAKRCMYVAGKLKSAVIGHRKEGLVAAMETGEKKRKRGGPGGVGGFHRYMGKARRMLDHFREAHAITEGGDR